MNAAAPTVFVLLGLITAPVATAAVIGPAVNSVSATGAASFAGGQGACEVVVAFEASSVGIGVVDVGGACLLTHWVFALGDCQDACTGSCEVGEIAICWDGRSLDLASTRAELTRDGHFTYRVGSDLVSGELTAIWP